MKKIIFGILSCLFIFASIFDVVSLVNSIDTATAYSYFNVSLNVLAAFAFIYMFRNESKTENA